VCAVRLRARSKVGRLSHPLPRVRAPTRGHARVHEASMAMARTWVAGDRSGVMVCCQITVGCVQKLNIWLCAVPLHSSPCTVLAQSKGHERMHGHSAQSSHLLRVKARGESEGYVLEYVQSIYSPQFMRAMQRATVASKGVLVCGLACSNVAMYTDSVQDPPVSTSSNESSGRE
jgi:hypothetical protein